MNDLDQMFRASHRMMLDAMLFDFMCNISDPIENRERLYNLSLRMKDMLDKYPNDWTAEEKKKIEVSLTSVSLAAVINEVVKREAAKAKKTKKKQ